MCQLLQTVPDGSMMQRCGPGFSIYQFQSNVWIKTTLYLAQIIKMIRKKILILLKTRYSVFFSVFLCKITETKNNLI